MATRKNSSKAKSKTARAASVSNSKSSVRNINLSALHKLSIVTYLVLAVLAFLYMGRYSQGLFVGFMGKDPLLSVNNTVFAPAIKHVIDLEFRWVLIAALLISCVAPILYLTKLAKKYQQGIADRMVWYRWVDASIVVGLMVVLTAMLSGISDSWAIKLIGLSVLVGGYLGCVAERQNKTAGKPDWSAFTAKALVSLVVAVLIGLSALATIVYGKVRSPWYVYAEYAVLLVGLVLVMINQSNAIRRFRNWAKYELVERNYLLINLATRVSFAVILILGLKK